MKEKKVIKLTRSKFAEKFLYLNGQPFSLADYPHMYDVYDTQASEFVMKTSRQVSKCVLSSLEIKVPNGSKKRISDLRKGDSLFSFDVNENKIIINKIKDIKDNGVQIIYKILTFSQRAAYVTKEHPFWMQDRGWVEARDLSIGDKIGVAKKEEAGSDIYFDEIIDILLLRKADTTTIEMESPHNTFLIDGIVTHNSTTIANILLADALMNPYFKAMYVSPTSSQTKAFSNERVTPVMNSSPLIKEYYTNAKLVNNVFTKQFVNGSRLYLQYALLNADKLRGLSVDKIAFDECQDLRPDVIPVIQESTSRSMVKQFIYAGTPKRSKGTLASYWFRSTQNEYIVKCNACNHWNILNEENIGSDGVICQKCGRPLPLSGEDLQAEWVSTYSTTQKPSLEGFRVCALHFAESPWVSWDKDIIKKRENAPNKAIFYNEVLGLEFDEGSSPITEMEIQACCNFESPMSPDPNKLDLSYTGILGIDYGPINSENSYTTICVLQRRLDKYKVVYMKKFTGKEADYAYIHRAIPDLMKKWNCSHLASDYGMGEGPNSEIRSRIGFEKVIPFQHNNNQKELMVWNAKMSAYTLNRNASMLRLFSAMKKQKIEFPAWEYFKPFAEDIMNIQSEFDEETGRMRFTNIGPDDFFHSLLYALMAIDRRDGETLLDS